VLKKSLFYYLKFKSTNSQKQIAGLSSKLVDILNAPPTSMSMCKIIRMVWLLYFVLEIWKNKSVLLFLRTRIKEVSTPNTIVYWEVIM
jgi:hypothetical protein